MVDTSIWIDHLRAGNSLSEVLAEGLALANFDGGFYKTRDDRTPFLTDISVLTTVQTPGINIVGMTMILQFVVSFGFILPVNAPQNMIAYGTDTFEARDFVRTGIVITLAAVVLLVVFALTYWPWLGLMVTRA